MSDESASLSPEARDLLYRIESGYRSGVGVRTTEAYDQTAALAELVQAGRVVFCTEKFRQLKDGSWCGDYCWILPEHGDINRSRPGFIPVEKVPVAPERAWDLDHTWQRRLEGTYDGA